MSDTKKAEFKVGDKCETRAKADATPPVESATVLVQGVKKGDGVKFDEGAWVYSVLSEDGKHSYDIAETDLSAGKGTESRPLRSGGKLFKVDEQGNTVEIKDDEPAKKPSKLVTHTPTKPQAIHDTPPTPAPFTAEPTKRSRV